MPIFSLFKFDQSKPRNNAFWHCREKKFFSPKKQNFSKPKKSAFPKGLAYAFRQKMPFSLYLDLVNIRLEIMVNYFEETKETFLTIKNRIFQSSKKRTFSKGFGQKNTIFKIYSDLVKIRVEIMLKLHWREKRNRFDYKKSVFQSLKDRIFSKGLTHAFGLKMPIFSLFEFEQNEPRNNAF